MSLLEMSISAGLLIIGIVVIRSVALNKLPKNIFLILWGIVVLRLLIPFSIPVSNVNVNLNSISINDIIKDVITDTVVPESNQQSLVNDTTEPIIPIYQNQNYSSDTIVSKEVEEIEQESFTPVKLDINYKFIIWISGMCIAVCYFTITYLRSDRKLCFSLPIRDNKIINELLDRYKLIRHINIFESDRITTPVATGFIKPRIILPKYMNKNDEQLLQYVITHEYFHIKRMDILWKVIMTIALCIHWFNPMVWVMYILTNRDLEITCDEKVIRCLGVDLKAEYAYSLISMIDQRSKLTPIYSSFSKNAVEERIKSIMKYKKTSIVAIILSIIMILGTTTMFTINATPDDIPEDDEIIETFDINSYLYEKVEELLKSSANDMNDNEIYEKIKELVDIRINDAGAEDYNQEINLRNNLYHMYTIYENGYLINLTSQAVIYEGMFIYGGSKNLKTIEIELDRTYTVAFSESVEKYIDNETVIELIKAEIPKIKEENDNYVIDKFIVNTIVELKNFSGDLFIGKPYYEYSSDILSRISYYFDDLDYESSNELAKKFFDEKDIIKFAAIISYANNDVKLSLLEAAYNNEEILYFCTILNVYDEVDYDTWAERTYEDNRISIFSILINHVSQNKIDELMKRAYEDQNLIYLSILMNAK